VKWILIPHQSSVILRGCIDCDTPMGARIGAGPHGRTADGAVVAQSGAASLHGRALDGVLSDGDRNCQRAKKPTGTITNPRQPKPPPTAMIRRPILRRSSSPGSTGMDIVEPLPSARDGYEESGVRATSIRRKIVLVPVGLNPAIQMANADSDNDAPRPCLKLGDDSARRAAGDLGGVGDVSQARAEANTWPIGLEVVRETKTRPSVDCGSPAHVFPLFQEGT
jgi:hypothetical protein